MRVSRVWGFRSACAFFEIVKGGMGGSLLNSSCSSSLFSSSIRLMSSMFGIKFTMSSRIVLITCLVLRNLMCLYCPKMPVVMYLHIDCTLGSVEDLSKFNVVLI